MPSSRMLALGVLAVIGACGDESSSGATPFPKLASYEQSCAVDADCALVPGEGCAACDPAALNATAAPSYTATHAEARKDPACQKILATAGPCREAKVKDEARCEASLCVARQVVPTTDAGRD